MSIKSVLRIVLLLTMFGGMLSTTTGCIFSAPAELYANPQSGVPSLSDGGLMVTFASNGIIQSIDYGDGETGVSNNHLYVKVGEYQIVAKILIKDKTKIATLTVTVRNNPPKVYPPFVSGSYTQKRGIAIVDGRRQQHGCTGGGTAENYGAWPRYGEVFIYSWKITIRYPDDSELVVFGDGSEEYPLSLISWHVGSAYKVFPDQYPVPTIDGIWIPSNYAPRGTCPDVDPWDDYPEAEKTAVAIIEMHVENQLGCWAVSTNTVNVYNGGGCN